MKEKNQAEWIYEVLGKKKGILGASIRELTDADEKKIREEMLRYWKEHNDESTEFLVNGAVLCCSRGSDYSTLNSADHGVYTDSSETGALANTDDKKFDGFVACSKWNDEPLVSKHICRFKLGEWRNVRKSVTINGKYALDTNSYLPCKHGGIISPVTSGQEYTLSKSYNKYPKFLNDDGTVDELIVKKLLLRNVSVMKENEIDALIKLGIYLCVCKDVEILKKIINYGYIYTDYYSSVAEKGIQCTLLDNFIFACAWAEKLCRFSAYTRKVSVVQNATWERYGKICDSLKANDWTISSIVSSLEETNNCILDMFLNVKLLETMLLAGNLYKEAGNTALVSLSTKMVDVKTEQINKSIKTYTIEYVDGQMDSRIVVDPNLKYPTGSKPGFKIYFHKVHLFSVPDNLFMSGVKKSRDQILSGIGAKISGAATIITYGTAAVSLAMANPIFSAISATVGTVCTVLSTSVGIADALRSEAETEYNKILASDDLDACSNISLVAACMNEYMAYACYEIEQPDDNEAEWRLYEEEYKGKTESKARKLGYATRSNYVKNGKFENFSLGSKYSYSISILDGDDTLQRLKNFNNNMKNIRISGKDGTGNLIPPKTISEGEGLENFQECKNFNELMEYMQRYTKNNEYNLFALSIIGLDGTGYNGRITYVMDNGEEKVVRENGVLYLGDLFQDNSQ